jgi:TRAP-type C4-dicarboxylate transport system permease small subunit
VTVPGARPAPSASRTRAERPVISKILNGYYRLLQVALTLLMTALIVPVTMQILSRYTGLIPRYIWTEEIARFCFIWIVMIGAMIAVRDGTHFDVDVLPRLSHKVEAGLRIFVHVAMLAASLIFVTYGYQFAKFGSIQTSEIAGLPMLSIYIAWPLAGITWIAFLGEKFREDVRILRGEIPPPVHEIPKAE